MISIDLNGRVALVTGGGQGLGQATALRLNQAGAAVAVNYFPDTDAKNEDRARATIGAMKNDGMIVAADVRSREQMEACIAAVIQRFGRLDIVVNNAAIIRDKTLKKMDDADWQAVIDTNLTGVFNVCKAAQPVLADGGRIVSMASISGVVGFFGQANYSSAKAGVIAMTKVLSKELAKRQITVNAVAPGVVMTEMAATIPDEVQQEMLKQIPLGSFGEPNDIANAILFLCSDLAKYITGQTIHVNGGWWA